MVRTDAPAYACGASYPPLREDTIGSALRCAVETHGPRDAMHAPSLAGSVSYQDLLESATSVARALLEVGVQRGDRVAVYSGNRPEWLYTQYGGALLGAIVVALNPLFRGYELGEALVAFAPTILFASRRYREVDHVQAVEAALERCRQEGKAPPRLVWLEEWADFVSSAQDSSLDPVWRLAAQVSPGDGAAVYLTSGTTGGPNGALLSHRTLINCGVAVGDRMALEAHDKIAVPVPLCHVFGSAGRPCGFHPRGLDHPHRGGIRARGVPRGSGT